LIGSIAVSERDSSVLYYLYDAEGDRMPIGRPQDSGLVNTGSSQSDASSSYEQLIRSLLP